MNNERPENMTLTPQLEARIVALVLGEASDFERDQLTELIEREPELAAFRTEIEDLHGLMQELGEGDVLPENCEWKLSDDRRAHVLAAIECEPGDAPDKPETPSLIPFARGPSWGRRGLLLNVLKIAAVLCVAGFVGSSMMRTSRVASDQAPRSGASIDEHSAAIRAKALDSASNTWRVPGVAINKERLLKNGRYDAIRPRDVQAWESAIEPNDYGSVAMLDGAVDSRGRTMDMSEYKGMGMGMGMGMADMMDMDMDMDGKETEMSVIDGVDEFAAFGSQEISEEAPMDSKESLSQIRESVAKSKQLPSPYYLQDDVQYFPAGPEFKLPAVASSQSAEGLIKQESTSSGAENSDGGMPADSPVFSGSAGAERRFGFRGQDSYYFEPQDGDDSSGDQASSSLFGVSDGTASTVPEPSLSDSVRIAGKLIENEQVLERRGSDAKPRVVGQQLQDENPGAPTTEIAQSEFLPGKVLRYSVEPPSSAASPAPAKPMSTEHWDFAAPGNRFYSTDGTRPPIATTDAPIPQESDKFAERRNIDLYMKSDIQLPDFGSSQLGELMDKQPAVKERGFREKELRSKSDEALDQIAGLNRSLEESLRAGSPQGQQTLRKRLGSLPSNTPQRPDDATAIAGRTAWFDDNVSILKDIRLRAIQTGLQENTAERDAFSTFSLHVSDVSFKLAQTALARGEWPEKNKIRIEEFVNAFDYGDPMPGKSERVACLVEQSTHPFLQQRNLLRVSMRTAAAGRASNTPLRLTFLLDNSGSMERADRRETVRRAFSLLVQQLKPFDQVTLISFARQPRLLADRVSGKEASQLVKQIDELPSEGGTNLESALQLAFEKAKEQFTDDAQNRIVLLTDGAVNLGDANPESLTTHIAKMRDAGIAFDAAGISAKGLNDEVLETLTRQGDGRYYLLDSVEDAEDGFVRQIAGALRPSAKNVKVQVEFNPDRVGHYKLLGFEKHRLKKEDFRNDQVDAAEMAAAEAGVAMYQFEPNPQGQGDVGSVSVRFRDLSTGQMVENRWPIPYQSHAPNVDEAVASMKVATSAAMLAAKLRGGPLGEVVDLKVLSNLIAGLSEQERSVKRVQQLQTMLQQARQVSGR